LSDKYQNSQVQHGQCPSYPKKCLCIDRIIVDSQVLEVGREGIEVECDHIDAGGEVDWDKQDGDAQEGQEGTIVGGAHTVVEPLAVVIEVIHTSVTLRAVLRTFQTVSLAQVTEMHLIIICLPLRLKDI
jgi:hypothetical protein